MPQLHVATHGPGDTGFLSAGGSGLTRDWNATVARLGCQLIHGCEAEMSDERARMKSVEGKILVSPPGSDLSRLSRGASRSATFVDLDGTLIATDLLHEGALGLVASNIRYVGGLFLAAIRGPAACKRFVSERWTPEVTTLPYRVDVLDYLRERKAKDERIVLATASAQVWADAVASHLGLFDAVLATTPERNLKGMEKLRGIEAFCATNNLDFRCYIGDSAADLPMWRACREACLVGSSRSLAVKIAQTTPLQRTFTTPSATLQAVLKALRPHQWAKNLLLFIPLAVSHKFTNSALVGQCVLAFIAFSLLASTIYIVNDLCDLQSDRAHPRKRNRPFAAGVISVALAPAIIGVLLIGSVACAWFLPWPFIACLATYSALSISYSLKLKAKPMVDVVLLGCLYTLRVIGGGAATAIRPSEWLLGFSLFIFTSLAFAKRYAELARLRAEEATTAKGRGYVVADLPLVETLGVASGYIAVLVLALYIQSPATATLYRSPSLLWLLCPIFLFWTSRLWLICHRGELDEDPVVFALSDITSRVVLVVAVVILFLAATL